MLFRSAGANIAKRWTNNYKQEIIESRTLSTELLFNALKKNPHQVTQIVSASGTAIYPESHTKIYDETTAETEDSFLANVVVKWEESVDRFQTLGLKVCKLRTGVVFANNGPTFGNIGSSQMNNSVNSYQTVFIKDSFFRIPVVTKVIGFILYFIF